jgi:tRNA nucleotidyltransferase/poly(A) polymerase
MQPHRGALPDNILCQIPPFVTFILEQLKKAGHQALVVGGAVRNAALKRAITDWDVATSASPAQIRTLFQDVRLFTLKHKTLTLVDSGKHFEVTTFKGDGSCLRDDLAHRDFTINAMAFDSDRNQVLDPFCGQKDIRKKLVRAVGNPESRFYEDPLRLLRAVRLATELGFQVEKRTLQTIRHMSQLLPKVAPERIREEFMKILLSPKPSIGFNLMRKTQVLEQFLPELLEGYQERQHCTIYEHIMETTDRLEPTPVLRLTAIFHHLAKPSAGETVKSEWCLVGDEAASAEMAAKILERLRFSHHMIARVSNLIRHHIIAYEPEWSDGEVRHFVRRVGLEDIMDLIGLRRADVSSIEDHTHQLELLRELEMRIKDQIGSSFPLEPRDLAIDGRRVMEILGIMPGAAVGRVLTDLLEKVIDHPELNTEEHLIAMVEKMKHT